MKGRTRWAHAGHRKNKYCKGWPIRRRQVHDWLRLNWISEMKWCKRFRVLKRCTPSTCRWWLHLSSRIRTLDVQCHIEWFKVSCHSHLMIVLREKHVQHVQWAYVVFQKSTHSFPVEIATQVQQSRQGFSRSPVETVPFVQTPQWRTVSCFCTARAPGFAVRICTYQSLSMGFIHDDATVHFTTALCNYQNATDPGRCIGHGGDVAWRPRPCNISTIGNSLTAISCISISGGI